MAPIPVTVLLPFGARERERLEAAAPGFAFTWRDDDVAALADAEVEVLLAGGLPDDPAAVPALRWLQLPGVGLDALSVDPRWEARAADAARTVDAESAVHAAPKLVVTSAAGAYTSAVAEHAIAGLLAGVQRVPERLAHQRERRWPEPEQVAGRPLRGATLAVAGYGSIGREVARLATAFGMEVVALKHDPHRRREAKRWTLPGTGDPDGVLPRSFAGLDALAEVARAADHLVLALPLTPATRAIAGADVLAALGPDGWLVNVGRGGLLDEPALSQALASGSLGGAALDVFATEPLPPDSPLWALPNVLVTPHVAGRGSDWPALAALVADNLARWADGRELRNRVDLANGY